MFLGSYELSNICKFQHPLLQTGLSALLNYLIEKSTRSKCEPTALSIGERFEGMQMSNQPVFFIRGFLISDATAASSKFT